MYIMPYGDYDFDGKIKPELDAFFSPIAHEIEKFANRYNLRLNKYYLQWHQWDLTFIHPHGGIAKINVMKESDSTIKISCDWYIDDYDEGIRSIKNSLVAVLEVISKDFTRVIGEALRTILAWEKNEWTLITPGFKSNWHKIPRDVFEDYSMYPVPDTNTLE